MHNVMEEQSELKFVIFLTQTSQRGVYCCNLQHRYFTNTSSEQLQFIWTNIRSLRSKDHTAHGVAQNYRYLGFDKLDYFCSCIHKFSRRSKFGRAKTLQSNKYFSVLRFCSGILTEERTLLHISLSKTSIQPTFRSYIFFVYLKKYISVLKIMLRRNID